MTKEGNVDKLVLCFPWYLIILIPVLEWNKIKTELYISLKVEKLNLKTACAVKNFILVNLKSHFTSKFYLGEIGSLIKHWQKFT